MKIFKGNNWNFLFNKRCSLALLEFNLCYFWSKKKKRVWFFVRTCSVVRLDTLRGKKTSNKKQALSVNTRKKPFCCICTSVCQFLSSTQVMLLSFPLALMFLRLLAATYLHWFFALFETQVVCSVRFFSYILL